MTWRFTQAERKLPQLGISECHLLEALEGSPRFARLVADGNSGARVDGENPCAHIDYEIELVTDTGANREPYSALMLVAFDVPQNMTREVDAWYDQEHIKLLMQADGWLRARRFQVLGHSGKRWTSLAFHELRDISVLDSSERKIARSTSWRAELERDTWFQEAGRWVFLRG